MSKIIKRLFCSFLILVTIIGIPSVLAEERGDLIDEVNTIGDITTPGGVKLTKTLSIVDKAKGIYNVKLDIISKNATKSENKENPIYAVVVFDTSGSMCESHTKDCGDKWKNATTGAIEFSKELLKNAKKSNIALVNFSTGATVKRQFSSSELTINDFKRPNGGTNIKEGLSKAKEILDTVKESKAKKYIVLMSDGEPDVYPNFGTDIVAIEEAKEAATAVKKANIELFAVGYDTTTKNADFLREIVSSPDTKYYADGKISDIKDKFSNIVKDISNFPAGTDVTITDIIGDNFTYVENTKSEGVTINNKKVTINIDELTEETSSFNFNIKIDNNSKTGWYDTNKEATIKYTDYLAQEVTKSLEKSSKVYWVLPEYNYIINYYKDSIDKDNLIDKITGTAELNKEITIDTTYKIPEGYHYSGDDNTFIIKEKDNVINVIYSKKNDLSYCINYFYGGIIDINNTECFYGQPYGKKINSFIDKPKEGFTFDNFEPITVLDKEENIMNVYYKAISSGEITPPNTNVNSSRLFLVIISSSAILGAYIIKKRING